MTLEHVFFLSQTMAAVGVVAALIFVGIQVRVGAKATGSATAQAVHDNYPSWYLALADNPAALATCHKGFVDRGALSAPEKAQFVCTVMAFMSHPQNAYHQWRQGHLAAELWASWEALMMNLVNTLGGAAFWKERAYVFGEDFGAEVKAILARKPHPEGRAFGFVPVTHRAGEQAQ